MSINSLTYPVHYIIHACQISTHANFETFHCFLSPNCVKTFWINNDLFKCQNQRSSEWILASYQSQPRMYWTNDSTNIIQIIDDSLKNVIYLIILIEKMLRQDALKYLISTIISAFLFNSNVKDFISAPKVFVVTRKLTRCTLATF